MQTAKAADEVVTRAEEEVIGVAQNDRRPTGQQIARAQRLDRGLGANRHKYRRIEGPMRGVEPSQTCLTMRVGVEELEGQWHTLVPRLSDHQKPLSSRLSKRVNSPRKVRRTTPVGPFRCFAMLISAMPLSGLSSGL